MGDLLSYSGITTKVRAMESRLITEGHFRDMASLETVSDAVEYLRRLPAYEGVFQNLEGELHRGVIEQRLILSLYQDFAKLYRFANLDQRKFLDLYFMHFEIRLIKKCFRNAMGRSRPDIDLLAFREFFDKHSRLDLVKLSSSSDISSFIANLEGSIYYGLLAELEDGKQPALFDYEVRLDLLYFKSTWKVMGRHLTRKERKILSRCFGSRMDLLNIQWIYRSKKYYHLQSADIYSLLIPIHYQLTREQVTKMVEAASDDEFYGALRSTFYGRLTDLEARDRPDLESLTQKALGKIYRLASQQNPYSIAVLNSYLYFKEEEIQKIITLIESIRYSVNPEEIISYVVAQ